MAIDTTDNDIIVVLSHYLRTQQPLIEFAQIDSGLGFPVGTTAQFLEIAAEEAGLEVVRKGATHASLQRRAPRLRRA
jgi:hypothetical protein